MNQANPKNNPAKTDETSSNNENNKKQTTTIQADKRKVYVLKAGIRKQAQQSSFSVLTIFPE